MQNVIQTHPSFYFIRNESVYLHYYFVFIYHFFDDFSHFDFIDFVIKK